jgi:acyl carrier protein
MVPRLFSVLDRFPINPAGKIDRDRLARVARVRLGADVDYVAPRTDIEQAVAQIIADVLDTERVGLTHNLFDLGAHSLSVTQVLTRLGETFAVEVRLRDVFEHPTVEEIAALVQDAIIAEAALELGYTDEAVRQAAGGMA